MRDFVGRARGLRGARSVGRWGRWVAAAAVLVCGCGPVHAAAARKDVPVAGLGTIPAVQGHTLAGDMVRLPGDLAGGSGGSGEGRTAVLIVGFSRDASGEAREWGLHLAADSKALPGTVYYEMPVLAGVPRLLRGAILRMMSGSVSERGRHHFLPVTDQEAAWRKIVGFQSPEVPYLLVVDDHGMVQWRSSGPFSTDLYAQLREHLPSAGR